MDPSSSSVGFPLPGNSQSPENSPPPQSSTVGFPLSENSPPPQSSSDGILRSESFPTTESIQTPLNQQITCNGPPTLAISDKEWNEVLGNFFNNFNFCFDMRESVCGDDFGHWYGCMHRATYVGTDTADCSRFAGLFRNCVFANVGQFKSLLKHFSDKASK